MFMERYQEVIQELARVEHKIENNNSDGGSSTIRRTGSGRSTLQAIGSAAAAGQVALTATLGEGEGKGLGGREEMSKSEDLHDHKQKPKVGDLS